MFFFSFFRNSVGILGSNFYQEAGGKITIFVILPSCFEGYFDQRIPGLLANSLIFHASRVNGSFD